MRSGTASSTTASLSSRTLRSGRTRSAPSRRRPPGPPCGGVEDGLHDSELIELEGTVVDRTILHLPPRGEGFSGTQITWLIQSGDIFFDAVCQQRGDGPPGANAEIGSRVRVTGVCSSETGTDGRLNSMQMLVNAPSDVRVLAAPSWFTYRRLLAGSCLLLLALLAISGWTLALDRQLREKITASKTAELQFKAVLAERTRLARDLHDGVAQTLAGISLQIDAAARHFARSPAAAAPHLTLAQTWMHRGQLELRRSIWDLRSRELEQFDLSQALRRSAESMTEGTPIRVEAEVLGPAVRMDEVIEENLLRIAQEALANVMKHSAASLVRITLQYEPHRVTLVVADNGHGFSPGKSDRERNRQFGLLGMSERAKRLNGWLEVLSRPGEGVRIRTILPLGAAT